jgi:hypothetical protein
VLHLVTLATVPATALYAFLGLLTTPITIPLMVFKRFITFLIFSPLVGTHPAAGLRQNKK